MWLRLKQRLGWLIRSLWLSWDRWSRCDCVDLSAAFAYYTLQSIFPILLISLSVASWFLGRQQGLVAEIMERTSQMLPPSVVGLVDSTLTSLVQQGVGAGLLGALFLMITAGNAYLTLQRGSERIWQDVLPQNLLPLPWSVQALRFIRNRLEAFIVVFLVGFLLVLDELSANIRMIPIDVWDDLSRSMPFATDWLGRIPVLQMGKFALPFLSLSGLALLMQVLLHKRSLPVRPLVPGSLLIGFLLTCLNLVVSKSIISLGSQFQAYGLIGSVLVLTLWVWMVGVVLYFGQCLSVELTSEVLHRRGEPNLLGNRD